MTRGGPAGPGGPGRLGVGLLWRPENARPIREAIARGRVGFVEVIAESVHGGDLPAELDACRQAGAVLVPHGVGLGLGGARRPDRRRLQQLARAAEACRAPLVSEHIAFVRAGRVEAGHLLPVPRTRAALDVLVANVRRAEAALPVPLALEPIAALVDWPAPELDEAAFLAELLDRTGVDLVLDLANLHVNAANRRRAGGTGADTDTDAAALMASLPAGRIAYVHVAGGTVRDGRYHDTHTHPLWPEVTTLVEELWARTEPPGLLLERETRVTGEELDGELAALEAAITRGRPRRRPGAGSTAASSPDEPPATPRTVGPAARVRRALGATQLQLLRAVAGRATPPPGFAEADIDAVADVLAHKRAHAVRQAVPELGMTHAFGRSFVAWARTHPLAGGGPARDARRFFRWLGRADRTAAAGTAVAAASLRPGRWPIRPAFYRTDGGTVVGVRIGRWRATRRPSA